MKLETTWLGLPLKNPLVAGASPLCDDLDASKRLEDAGVAALVMHSLFEEQIALEQRAADAHFGAHYDAHAEATSYIPAAGDYHLGPDAYLDQIRRLRAALSIPVVASLNGVTGEGWVRYAKLMQDAGASALELNPYMLATDASKSAADLEDHLVEVVTAVKGAVTVPVAVKLSPFYTSLPHLAARLDPVVNGLVLFNRFYQPDIDPVGLEIVHRLRMSSSSDLLLRTAWIAILFGQVKADLALTGGVHCGLDAVKAVMSGATAVQVVSDVLQHGPDRIRIIRDELLHFAEEHGYTDISEMRGNMSLGKCPDPQAFERGNYMKVLHTWKPGAR